MYIYYNYELILLKHVPQEGQIRTDKKIIVKDKNGDILFIYCIYNYYMIR